MKTIFNLLFFVLLLPSMVNAAPALIEGDYTFYDFNGTAGFTGGYTGQIDIISQTGTLQSNEPFFGQNWTANIKKVFVYDEITGGEQHFSWDIVKQIWFDPISPNGIVECYIDGSNCDSLSPGAILLIEEIISHPFVMNAPGQFAIGTFVSWGINEIPNLMTLQSQSGVLDPASTTFEAFDGDLDGIPGYAMIAPPFPGQTIAFNGFIGVKEGIFISDLAVAGGEIHECTSVNGSNINASASVTVINDFIESIEWLLDGNIVGADSNVNLTASLGEHQLTINATALSGKTASASTSIIIRDTTPPEISVEYIDTKSNTVVNTIDRNGLTRLIASYAATDICDIAPTVTATGGFNIVDQSFLPLKVLNDEIIMDIPEIMISAIATDSSGNSKSSSATLMIK